MSRTESAAGATMSVSGQRVGVKMTLTAPGCGMGTAIAADAQEKILCLPGVAAALARLSDHRKDVFAPDTLPVAVRVDSLLAEGESLLALDESGDSLLIAGDASAQIVLTSALAGALSGILLGLEAYPIYAATTAVRGVVGDLIGAVENEGHKGDYDEWWTLLNDMKRTYPLGYEEFEDGSLAPQYVMERLSAISGPETYYVAGVGQHQMWASQFWRFSEPRTWVNSGGLCTMGFAVPSALGAAAGRPDKRVIAIDGDGCFQMTAQELATSRTENIPFITAIINNAHLGMVRQWQELFYEERYSQVHLSYDVPDYVKLVAAYGAVGLRAERPEEVDAVSEKSLSVDDRSVVIDMRCDDKKMCFPMGPAGASNDDIITGPEGLRPQDDPAEAPIA